MKVFIVLAVCFVSCASAGHLGGYGAAGYAAPAPISTGTSSQFREEDTYGNYKFGYDESHASGRTGRREEKNGETVSGSYNLYDADGRDRTVHYVADHQGFRATIHTNEPGVDASRDPAAVLINKEGYAAVPAPELAPAYKAGPAYGPAPLPLPLPAGPAYNKGYGAPLALPAPLPAPAYAAPAPAYAAPAPAYAPKREAFNYSFGTSHPAYAAPAPAYAAPAPVYAAPAPAPLYAAPAAPAPIRQLGLKY